MAFLHRWVINHPFLNDSSWPSAYLFLPFRFQVQLQSCSNQIRGCLQHHVQCRRPHPTAQQWVLVQGGMHAEGPDQLGCTRPADQLCTGPDSPLILCIAGSMAHSKALLQKSLSPTWDSFHFLYFALLTQSLKLWIYYSWMILPTNSLLEKKPKTKFLYFLSPKKFEIFIFSFTSLHGFLLYSHILPEDEWWGPRSAPATGQH